MSQPPGPTNPQQPQQARPAQPVRPARPVQVVQAVQRAQPVQAARPVAVPRSAGQAVPVGQPLPPGLPPGGVLPHREVFHPTDIADLMNQAPWWVVSLVIHGILLILLAAINFAPTTTKRKEVMMNTELVEIEEYERPVVTRNILTDEMVESETVEELAQTQLEDVSAEVPVMRVAPISMSDIAGLISTGSGLGFDASGTGGNLLGKVGAGSRYTIKTVVDALAAEILKDIQKHDLLVAMLFDESKSLLEDRKLIARQVQKTIGDLKKEMTPKEAARLKWAVISYGEKPTMWLQPTGDLEKVVEATDKVKVDASGKENIIEAINFTMKNLGVLRKPMFIVVVTDEEGSDVKKTEDVNAALQSMVATKTRFFVFGREASFQMERVQEWLRDKNGERMGPWAWADRGLESCDYEFFIAVWFMIPTYHATGVPAGFGCWLQSMLAQQTGGTFYILSDIPSPYDDELMESYKPEWEPRDVYQQRTESSRMRETMNKLFKDFHDLRPHKGRYLGGWHWITNLENVKGEANIKIEAAKQGSKVVEDAMDKLEPMRSRSKKEKFAPKRWEANYDLTMAELLRLRFILAEYAHHWRECLQKGFPQPKAKQKFNLFRIIWDRNATESALGKRGNRDWEAAKAAFDELAQKYQGTPWAETAKNEKKFTTVLKVEPYFHIEPTRPNL